MTQPKNKTVSGSPDTVKSSPFDIAKSIAYTSDEQLTLDPDAVESSEYMLNLILASSLPDVSLRACRYRHRINRDMYNGLIFYGLRSLRRTSWTWAKSKKAKAKSKKTKVDELLDDYITFLSQQLCEKPSRVRSEYFNILSVKFKDKEFIKNVLDEMQVPEERYAEFGITIQKKQQTLF